jgi:hypothetical protein
MSASVALAAAWAVREEGAGCARAMLQATPVREQWTDEAALPIRGVPWPSQL